MPGFRGTPATQVASKPAWRERALCQQNPQWFETVGYGATYNNERAKRVCARCPVVQECGEDALANPLDCQGLIRAGHTSDYWTRLRKVAKK